MTKFEIEEKVDIMYETYSDDDTDAYIFTSIIRQFQLDSFDDANTLFGAYKQRKIDKRVNTIEKILEDE